MPSIRSLLVAVLAVLAHGCGAKSVAGPEPRPAEPTVEGPGEASAEPVVEGYHAGACQPWDIEEARARHEVLEADEHLETLRSVKAGGKHGFIDLTGKVVVPLQYEATDSGFRGWNWVKLASGRWRLVGPDHALVGPEVDSVGEGGRDACPFMLGGKWGLLTRAGAVALEPAYDKIGTYRGEHVLVWKDKKGGFADGKGALVVPPTFEDAQAFSEGLAAVKTGGLWGFIDGSGKMAIAPRFKQVGGFHEGLAEALDDGEYGYIDPSGEWAVKGCQAGDFNGGFAIDTVDGKYAVVNKKCEVLAGGFDMVIVGLGFPPMGKKDGRYMFVHPCEGGNLTGKIYDDAMFFSVHEGLAFVKEGGLWAVINTAGTYLTGHVYEDVDRLFGEGLRGVKVDGKWGFIDASALVAIEPAFDGVSQFHDGLAPVRLGEKWGYVDAKGKLVVEPKYTYAAVFRGGVAYVEDGDVAGYVDTSGNLLWPE